MTRRALLRDRRGATIVEFALVLPVMLSLIMGLGELAYRVYVQGVLTGAMQKAGRDSTIQGSGDNVAGIDDIVMQQVRAAAPSATYSSTRNYYTLFSDITGEPFTDLNKNGVRDSTECYDDVNGNKKWDADISKSGQGGASDAVVYTITVIYPNLFPVAKWFGWAANQKLVATTILKNQPFATQNVGARTQICS